jgi:hypothetical protein
VQLKNRTEPLLTRGLLLGEPSLAVGLVPRLLLPQLAEQGFRRYSVAVQMDNVPMLSYIADSSKN